MKKNENIYTQETINDVTFIIKVCDKDSTEVETSYLVKTLNHPSGIRNGKFYYDIYTALHDYNNRIEIYKRELANKGIKY